MHYAPPTVIVKIHCSARIHICQHQSIEQVEIFVFISLYGIGNKTVFIPNLNGSKIVFSNYNFKEISTLVHRLLQLQWPIWQTLIMFQDIMQEPSWSIVGRGRTSTTNQQVPILLHVMVICKFFIRISSTKKAELTFTSFVPLSRRQQWQLLLFFFYILAHIRLILIIQPS